MDDGGQVVHVIAAFSQYTTRAFDVNAVDYVMKPFSDQRLTDALERARMRERRLRALGQPGGVALGGTVWREGSAAREGAGPIHVCAPPRLQGG